MPENFNEYDALPFGDLNPIEKRVISPAGRYDDSYVSQVYAATNRTLNEESILGKGPFKAICLRVEKTSTQQASWLERAISVTTSETGLNMARTKIKARIPELHAMLPSPANLTDNVRIDYYPTFVALDAYMPPPEAGSLVWVSFGNLENMTDPIYLGPVLDGPKPTMSAEALAAYAALLGLDPNALGTISFASAGFTPTNPAQFGPADAEAFVKEKHRQVLAYAVEEWKKNVGEPKHGNWQRIDRYIRGKECGKWTDRKQYVANRMFEWCGAFLTCPFRAAGLDPKMVVSDLMSTYRIGSAADKRDRVIKDKATIGPGDIVIVGNGTKKYGKHITLCWAQAGDPDPMYNMGYRNEDFPVDISKKPKYAIGPTIPPNMIRTVEGNAIGLGPIKGEKQFQGVITKLRSYSEIQYAARWRAEDYIDWPHSGKTEAVSAQDAAIDEVEEELFGGTSVPEEA